MGASDLDTMAATDREAVERRCGELVDALASQHATIAESIRYSLLGGGKRLRPLLCLWTHDATGGSSRDAALDAACAVECVHTYSLIHDDLPCMDDDDLRRGKPSSHVRFGEATAVLTGDALLNLSFEILSALPRRHTDVSAQTALDAITVLSFSAGTGGLITGQSLDLEAEQAHTGSVGDRRILVDRIHENKTGRLIAAAMELGAVVAGGDAGARSSARKSGLLAGRAFQIVDDVLDLETDKETLGKTPGKDVKSGKLTYPSVVGSEGARDEADRLIVGAVAQLPDTGDTRRLRDLLTFLVERRS